MADKIVETIPGKPADEGTSNQTETVTTEPEVSNPPTELSRRTVDELESSLPEKFRGKSAYEVYQAYQNAEKDRGRIASELGQARKSAEEAATKASLLEKQLQEQSARTTPTTQPQPEPEVDPLADFDKRFDRDPKDAVRYAAQASIAEARKAQAQADARMQQTLAQQRYEQLKKDKPDFGELEPEMVRLSQQFGAYLKPEVANRPETIDLLYDLARGRSSEKLITKALENAKKAGELVREEKRSAFSESSHSAGNSEKPFEELTLAEMEKRLDRAD